MIEHPYMDTADRGICDVCDRPPHRLHGPHGGAGRAVQDDGLDVERLAEAIRRTALDHYRPEASSSYAHRVAKHYAALRTAPPLHDPQEPER